MVEQMNWQAEVEKYFESYVRDLKELLKINSVRNDDQASDRYPVGPGPVEALDKVLEFGDRDGFVTEKYQNWAGHIEHGEGEEILGVLGHVDVVPAGNGWDTDPFSPVIKDGRLYARGASDDKGPTLAAYYAVKMLKDLGLPTRKKVRVIIGTDEESEWQGLAHYLAVEQAPDFAIAPDASFPIINGEKGNYTLRIEVGGDNTGVTRLDKFQAGLRPNMVPQIAQARLSGQVQGIGQAFEKFLDKTSQITGEISQDQDQLLLTLHGQASHGSKPENGVNAGTYLANFLKGQPIQGGAKNFLEIAGEYFHLDYYGEKVGLEYEDEVMGVLTSNPGIMDFDEEDGGVITVNLRYPQGIDEEKIFGQFHQVFGEFDVELVTEKDGKVPHYVSGDDPLVQTLLKVYEEQTGESGHEQVIGGGTYARLVDRGVAYGAMFPDTVDTMHKANEYVELEDMRKAMAIYAQAIYELIR